MGKQLVSLIVLDGWGIGEDYEGNAITRANTPNYDTLNAKYPHTELKASGLAVGLPEGQMGNSEVGHLNIGAGRVIYQELSRITKSIESGEFFKKEEFLNAIGNCKKNNSKLHLMGLLSNGGVHSHNTHLYALLELAKQQDLEEVYIHCFLDGRDTPPQSGKECLEELENKIKEIGVGKIATISGRYYAMDRDQRWDRVEKAYNIMTSGIGEKAYSSKECIEDSYAKKIYDEFVVPTAIINDNGTIGKIDNNDSVIFFNFRPDRAREITRAIVDEDFDAFARQKIVNTHFVCMTMYDLNIKNVEVAYLPETYQNTLGEYVSSLELKQLRIAETEKYAHVTFFFNGGVEEPNKGEDRCLIPSPKVATYDLQPEMSAVEVKDEVIKRIRSNEYDLIILNFANPDMVGHTGKLQAAIKAIETIDKCLGEVIEEILKVNGKVVVTADHGNAEMMIDKVTGEEVTSHTTNNVPCIVIGEGNVNLKKGSLCDIAPTLLNMMGQEKPSEMTGNSLIEGSLR